MTLNINDDFYLAEKLAGVGHWRVEFPSQKIYWSEQIYVIHGVSPDEYEPEMKSAIEFYHPDDRAHVQKCVEQGLANKKDFEFSLRLVRPTGEIRYVRSKSTCLLDESGELTGLFGIFHDVTEHEERTAKTEQQLRANLNFQKLLMNVNSDLFFVKDEEFRIVEANKAFLNLYPEDVRDSVIGTTTLESYDPEEAEGFLTEDRKAFEEGVSEVFETINFPDGTARTLLTKKTRFENSEGARFILGVARDITPLRKTEEALRNANEELEEFAYRTSHDLRSPLVSSTRLLNIVQKQIEKNDLGKAGEHIGMVISSLSNLENLVTDILQLTKIKYTQEAETEINIEELVETSINKLNHMEGFSAISIKKQFQHTGALFTYHDQILQVVENLISNAIKYYDPKKIEPSIKISTSSDDKHFFISVSDNGLGIPTKGRDKVFTMFKRFHPRTSFGSGLGLYMIKKCVEKMHGDISYLPLAKGTEFSIKIPLQEFKKA